MANLEKETQFYLTVLKIYKNTTVHFKMYIPGNTISILRKSDFSEQEI